MKNKVYLFSRYFLIFSALLTLLVPPQQNVSAAVELSIEPLTWNVIGLDSNNVNVGPNTFPIGARVCNTGNTAATNVAATFIWDTTTANDYIELRPGSLPSITIPTLAAGTAANPSCYDFYFEVSVDRDPLAYDTTREYHISVTSAEFAPLSTPTPRELYVEHLISQNRNSTNNVKLDGVSVGAGGTMTLQVGNTYTIQLLGSTATQGYNQLEDFINFPNTIFQILSVYSTYSADSSLYVANTSDKLYADGCLWDNDPDSPTYRSCLGSDGKVGGTITTTYTVKIIGGIGTTQPLNTLIYDFSGSSYHYNSDFSSAVRYATIVSPISMTKSFSSVAITSGGTSTLSIALTNSSSSSVTGISLTDPLPSGMTVATTPASSTSASCLTPSFSPSAGATSLTYTGGVAANSTCTLSVAITAGTGSYTNTTDPLKINSIDTGLTANASLTASTTTSGTNLCGINIATWQMTTAVPAEVTNPPGPTVDLTSGTAAATAGAGLVTSIDVLGASSWRGADYTSGTTLTVANNEYFQFEVDTTGYTSVGFQFDAASEFQGTQKGPRSIQLYSSTDGTNFTTYGSVISPTASFVNYNPAFTGTTNTAGKTYFRVYGYNPGNPGVSDYLYLDNVKITGCGTPQKPTLSKAFASPSIVEGGTTTLTFTVTNPNTASSLTAVAFSDTLPSGMTMTNPSGVSTTCSGTVSAPNGGTTLSLSGATLAAGSSCTIQVNVTSLTAGVYKNTSGFIASTESGTNTTSTGYGTATLTVLAPPEIVKSFSPNPIYVNEPSTLTFTITNPNAETAITGVAFIDDLPLNVTVPTAPAASQCGGTVSTSIIAGPRTRIQLTGGTIAAGGSCTLTVVTTSSFTGDYKNISGVVSSTNAGTGNTATDTLAVQAVHPGISIQKQVATSPSGPWTNLINVAPSGTVYYRLTIENIGDVPLSPVSVTDPTLNISSCTWPSTLLVGSTTVDPTASCVIGPVTAITGTTSNTATAHGTYSGTVYDSAPDTAVYATTDLTFVKSTTTTSFSAAGESIPFTYTITNTGAASLPGPLTVTDSNSTVTCPALSTVGNGDGSLDTNETIVCTANYITTAQDVSIGSVTNTASATIASVTSNTDRETVYRNLPELIVTKTNDTNNYATNLTPFTWTVTVINNGPAPATFTSGQTIVSDQLPAGATYGTSTVGATTGITNAGSISCSINGSNLLTCTASGTDVTIGATTGKFAVNITVTPSSTGSLINTAVVDPDLHVIEGNEGNNNGSDALTVNALSTPTIAKAFDPATIPADSTSTITLTLTNPNAIALTNASFTDTLANMAISVDQSAGGTCGGVGGNSFTATQTNLSFSGISIPASSSCTVTIVVKSSVIGTHPNSTSGITTTQTALGAVSNTANLVVTTKPELSVTKTNNVSSSIVLGGNFTWTLTGSNAAGAGTATFTSGQKILVDDLPTSPTYGTVTVTPSGTITGTGTLDCSITGGTLTCTANGGTVILPAGATFTASFSVIPSAGGSLANPASGVGKVCQIDPDTLIAESNEANNSCTDTVSVTAPSLSLAKSNTSPTITAGSTTTYTLEVTNNGTAPTNGEITVVDALPTYLSIADATFTASGWSCTASSNVITCKNSAVIAAAGGSSSFNITVNIASTAVGTIVNPAQVGGGGDPDTSTPTVDTAKVCAATDTPTKGCATHTDTVVNGPSLSLTKSNGGTTVPAGGTTTYTLTVSNTGGLGTDGTDITIVDVLPTHLSIANGTFTASSWSCTALSNVITCKNSAVIAAAGSSNFSITVNVASSATGTIVNPAQVGGGGDTATSTPTTTTAGACTAADLPTKGCAVDSDTVSIDADLEMLKVVDNSTPYAGSNIVFTLTVTNKGLGDASGVYVSDVLPSGYTYQSDDGGGDYVSGTGIWTIGALTNGSVATLKITAKVLATGTYNNTATVSSTTNDPINTNDEASQSITLNTTTYSISGFVYDDSTGTTSGSFDGSDIGINLVIVELFADDGTGKPTGTALQTITTNSSGAYSFTGVIPGNYVVVQTDKSTYLSVTDSDGDTGSPAYNQIPVTIGSANVSGKNFLDLLDASIQVVKTSSATVINSGGSVTYTYTVTNTGSAIVTSIAVNDDKCSPVTYQSGDAGTVGTLETTETWIYQCTTTLTSTTTNIATVSGKDPNNRTIEDTDAVTVKVIATGIGKSITGTNETSTVGNNVTIGEIITYTITIDLPAGTAFSNVTVTDRMDKGLAFVDCVSVNLAGLDITATACPPTVTSITDAGDLTTNPANPGRQAQFNIGDISAPAADTTLVIQYHAVVLDVIENRQPVTLNNSATWAWTGGSLSASAPNVTIVEPDMFIDKSVSPTVVQAGQSVTYTLLIYHNAPPSSADAFDVVVTDVLPSGLAYVPCSLTYSGLTPDIQPADPCNLGTSTLSFGWNSFPIGQTSTITFDATFTGAQQQVTNTAFVAWTSLPIDPAVVGGASIQQSSYNARSTERSYDPGDPADIYRVSDSVAIGSIGSSVTLPETGFAPNQITTLPVQPLDMQYESTDVWIEIPRLGTKASIVGIPFTNGEWDVSWLWNQAGWLDGTAFPSWEGNSVVSGHVYLPNGKPGIFLDLAKLKWDDKIIVHAYGSKYTYSVQTNKVIAPDDMSVLKHEDKAWITLLTCKTYNEKTKTYENRIAVRAVLTSIEPDK